MALVQRPFVHKTNEEQRLFLTRDAFNDNVNVFNV